MPRKRKTVTPDPVEIPDDVLEALGSSRPPSPAVVELGVPEDDTRRSLEEVSRALIPLSDELRATVTAIGLIPVAKASPAQRTQLVELRSRLDRARADLSTWVDAIDLSFRNAAIETGADEFLLDDGVVKIELPRGEWVVNVPALHDELKQLAAHGLVSAAELDAVFVTEVVTKANGSKLNYLMSHRGEEVADAIRRYRVWKAGNPMAAKVHIRRQPVTSEAER